MTMTQQDVIRRYQKDVIIVMRLECGKRGKFGVKGGGM